MAGFEVQTEEGNPYTGIDPSKSIDVNVELTSQKGNLVFSEATLQQILAKEVAATATEAAAKYRQLKRFDKNATLSKTQQRGVARFKARFAEPRMWDRVGELVRKSPTKVGEVVLEPGSQFSRSGSGKFAVVADASKIRLKGGVEPIVKTLTTAGGRAGAAFAVWFTPADTAGPWAAHGVGTLVAGGVGYWLGSERVRYIYELEAVE